MLAFVLSAAKTAMVCNFIWGPSPRRPWPRDALQVSLLSLMGGLLRKHFGIKRGSIEFRNDCPYVLGWLLGGLWGGDAPHRYSGSSFGKRC